MYKHFHWRNCSEIRSEAENIPVLSLVGARFKMFNGNTDIIIIIIIIIVLLRLF
jgi:hypothetical protein